MGLGNTDRFAKGLTQASQSCARVTLDPALPARSCLFECGRLRPKRAGPNLEIRRRWSAPSARRRATAADGRRPAAAAAVASALANLRNTLDLAPRALTAQALAVGRSRVAQLADGELIVRRLPDLEPVVRAPLRGSAAVTELLDGGLLAVGGDRVLRLDAGTTRWREYPRVTLLPGCFVYPDLIHGERFWVLHPFSGSLFRYELDGDAGGVGSGRSSICRRSWARVQPVKAHRSSHHAEDWRRSYSARGLPVRADSYRGAAPLPAKRLYHYGCSHAMAPDLAQLGWFDGGKRIPGALPLPPPATTRDSPSSS